MVSNGDKFRGNSDLTVTFSFEQSSHKAGTLVVVVEDGGRGMTGVARTTRVTRHA